MQATVQPITERLLAVDRQETNLVQPQACIIARSKIHICITVTALYIHLKTE
jgi:hypothetical protein